MEKETRTRDSRERRRFGGNPFGADDDSESRVIIRQKPRAFG